MPEKRGGAAMDMVTDGLARMAVLGMDAATGVNGRLDMDSATDTEGPETYSEAGPAAGSAMAYMK
jgi:uncharacterized protein YfaP (DUF2135 family)